MSAFGRNRSSVEQPQVGNIPGYTTRPSLMLSCSGVRFVSSYENKDETNETDADCICKKEHLRDVDAYGIISLESESNRSQVSLRRIAESSRVRSAHWSLWVAAKDAGCSGQFLISSMRKVMLLGLPTLLISSRARL